MKFLKWTSKKIKNIIDWLSNRKIKHYITFVIIVVAVPTIYNLLEDKKIPENRKIKDLKINDNIENNFLPTKEKNNNLSLIKQKISPFNSQKNKTKILQNNKLPTKKNTNQLNQQPTKKSKNQQSTYQKKINQIIINNNNKIENDLLEAISSNGTIENINYTYQNDNKKNQIKNWQDEVETNQNTTYPLKANRILPQGNIIRAIFNSRVNSENAGFANIIIDDDVYSQNGKFILIPKGSNGLLQYQNSEIKVGITRLSFELIRIVTPRNIIISFNDTKVSDLQGASGVPGNVNNNTFKKFGVPLLFNILNTTSQYASFSIIDEIFRNQSKNDLNNQLKNDLTENLPESNSKALDDILKNYINIQPKITIEIGTLFTITAFKDLYFKKPQKGIVYPTIEKIY